MAHDDSLCQFLEWDPVLGLVNTAIENSNSILESLLDHGADEPMLKVAVGLGSREDVCDDQSDGDEIRRYYQTDYVVDKWFRDLCIDSLGTSDAVVLKLLGHLLFTTWRADDAAVIDTKLMAAIVGKQDNKQAIIRPNLAKLNAVLPLDILEHDRRGTATRYRSEHIPRAILDGADHCYRPMVAPVHLGSGLSAGVWTKRLDADLRQRAIDSTTPFPNPVAELLLAHLNNLPPNTFTMRTSGKAWEALLARVEGLDASIRDEVRLRLKDIQLHPQPIYKRSSGSCRVYAMGGNFQNLSRDLREAAFEDCWKFDLRHSQLSISAAMFQATELFEMLGNGTAWEHFTSSAGLRKEELKRILYASLYSGQVEFQIEKHPYLKSAQDKDMARDQLCQFISIPAIAYLMNRRANFIENVLPGIQHDIFGNPLYARDRIHALPILMQSYEMKALQKPVEYLLALKERKNRMLLWLHDGFYYQARQKDLPSISRHLIQLTEEGLGELGIPGALEVISPETLLRDKPRSNGTPPI